MFFLIAGAISSWKIRNADAISFVQRVAAVIHAAAVGAVGAGELVAAVADGGFCGAAGAALRAVHALLDVDGVHVDVY